MSEERDPRPLRPQAVDLLYEVHAEGAQFALIKHGSIKLHPRPEFQI